MGIRNLATCILSTSTSTSSPAIRIHAWQRHSLPLDDTLSLPAYAAEAHRIVPALLAQHDGVRTALVEHQRWRTHGGAGVLQWTIRVNTFEAMLHAVLASPTHSLSAVECVESLAVAKTWGLSGRGVRAADVKREKVRVLATLLRRGEVEVGEEEGMRGLAERVQGGVMTVRGGEKLDDLADCALQGVTWIKWMRRRRRFVEEGVMPVEVLEGRDEWELAAVERARVRQEEEAEDAEVEVEEVEDVVEVVVEKRRRRPGRRKLRETEDAEVVEVVVEEKRRRGRPRKLRETEEVEGDAALV
ncbi:mitochondrial resolvase Ydc2 [Geopyxis carbonaria]|nr:mitochondrial resolvase Ydc2 [Geopyxis carbonaria]